MNCKNKYYSKEENIKSSGMLRTWIKLYLTNPDMLKSKIKREYETHDTIMHSDRGIIYSSIALSQVHKDYTITRSMSRIGMPTDNP